MQILVNLVYQEALKMQSLEILNLIRQFNNHDLKDADLTGARFRNATLTGIIVSGDNRRAIDEP